MRGGERAGLVACGLGLGVLCLWQAEPLLRCGGECLVDYRALRGEVFGPIEASDARLNAWILAWVQRALLTAPGSLFDANIFYPARNTLAASEHLIGVAALWLPLRAFGANAVLLHQVAVIGSSWLLALGSFALVRWLVPSSFAAFLAGTIAIFLPWRWSELSHVQLLNAQWLPLVWLLAGAVLQRRGPRHAAPWLALVAALQVLSSFYLAYYLAISLAVLVPVLWWTGERAPRDLGRVAAAGIAPGVVLVLLALPYLAWQSTSGFEPLSELFDSVRPGDAWRMLGPAFELGLRGGLPQPVSYEVPLAVAALAAAGVLLRGGEAGDVDERCRRGFSVALALLVAFALLLVLGRRLELGGVAIPLPAALLAKLVPGFENLRSPLRWGLLVGIASSILAGVGVWRLEQRLASRASLGPGARRGAVLALRGAVVVLLLLSLPWGRIPARAAWPRGEASLAVYRALASLPEGPVLEVPWPLGANRNVDLASRYMLGSTYHWKPLVNGTSGYTPSSFALLAEVASRLPSDEALEQLHALVDVRWIVVHGHLLPVEERAAWERAVRTGRLAQAYGRGRIAIYELPDWHDAGRWLPRLTAPPDPERTLSGLSRAPLSLAPQSGRLQAQVPGSFFFRGANRLSRRVPLRITNASDVPWPGLDVDPEGLVRVRYTFRDGETQLEDEAPLIVDVPAGRSVITSAVLRPPARAGRYQLELALVQRRGGRSHRLPVAPALLEVDVEEARLPVDER